MDVDPAALRGGVFPGGGRAPLLDALGARATLRRLVTDATEQREDVAEWVRSGIAAGSVRRDIDPDSVAAQYIAYITGMTYLWVIDPESIDFRKANENMKSQLKISLLAHTHSR